MSQPRSARTQRLLVGLWWACVTAVVWALGAAVSASISPALAIVLAAAGGASAVWLFQAAIVGLSSTGEDQRFESVPGANEATQA